MPFKRLKTLVYIFLFFSVAFVQPVTAQMTQAQARELLAQKGISEDTLRVRLLKKGYDLDKIRPDQVAQFQNVILETIQEIEADQITRTQPPPSTTVQSSPTQPVEPDITVPTTPVIPESTQDPKAPIYGQEIFRNNSIKVFQKSDEIIPNDDYVLGKGDKIGVVGFGRSQFEEVMEIGQDGFIRPSGIPRILLQGLTFGEAKELLYQRYNQYYVIGRGQFQVTISQPRSITVSVFGEARTPGAYTLPGFNTAFN